MSNLKRNNYLKDNEKNEKKKIINQINFEKLLLLNINLGNKNNDNFSKKREKEKPKIVNYILDKKENEEIKEVLIPGSKIIKLNPILEVSKSVCKIITPQGQGSGFLIKLFKREENFFCLMTNEHVITKDMINNEAKIEIHYNNKMAKKEIKLNPKERIIEIFTYIDVDISVVEILFKDKISTEFFLLPSIPYMEKFDNLINQSISIIHYPDGEFGFSNGKIEKIENYKFSHSASTEYGSSGSPIFLKDTTRVIGIHRSGITNLKPINYGNFIGPVYKYFKELPNYKYKSDKILFDNNADNKPKNDKAKQIIPFDNRRKFNININNNNKKLIESNPYKNQKIVHEDGSYYIGQIKDGLPDGKGIDYYQNGKVKYEGDFIKGKMEGYGIRYYKTRNYYIGEWKNNVRNGKGTYYDRNGKIIYEGIFRDGIKLQYHYANLI